MIDIHYFGFISVPYFISVSAWGMKLLNRQKLNSKLWIDEEKVRKSLTYFSVMWQ